MIRQIDLTCLTFPPLLQSSFKEARVLAQQLLADVEGCRGCAYLDDDGLGCEAEKCQLFVSHRSWAWRGRTRWSVIVDASRDISPQIHRRWSPWCVMALRGCSSVGDRRKVEKLFGRWWCSFSRKLADAGGRDKNSTCEASVRAAHPCPSQRLPPHLKHDPHQTYTSTSYTATSPPSS